MISFRGTDGGLGELILTDIPIAGNDDFDEPEVHLASKFYRSVAGSTGAGEITTTGHSLGGALVGVVGRILRNAHRVFTACSPPLFI